MSTNTRPERIETVIVGAGQAGLAVGKLLAERDRPFVILDALDRVGDNWRRHYDSLRLYSPACMDGLPGMDFPAPPYHYPGRDEVADFLEAYVDRFDLPVRTGTRVEEVKPRDDGGYLVTTDHGTLRADNVVVATGTFGRPWTPPFADELDPRTTQLHSAEYCSPSDLQPGRVLVVGASHSGADIALEVAQAGHETVLVGNDNGQVPIDIEGPARKVLRRVLPFVATRVLSLSTPVGRKMRPKIRSHGGPLLRVKRHHLEEAGVERITDRVTGVRNGRPVVGDSRTPVLGEDRTIEGAESRTLEVDNVVWCTGFRQDFSWIQLPIEGEDGWPREHRGVVDDAPGLYFMGLAFQYSFGSMVFVGVGKDARYVVDHLTARGSGDEPAPSGRRNTSVAGAGADTSGSG